MTRNLTSIIRESDAHQSLIRFLCERFTYHTCAEWTTLIQEGRVRINQLPVLSETLLEPGNSLTYDASCIREPPVNSQYRIILDDPLFLAIDKPGNLPCHPGGRYFNHTLWAMLKKEHNLPNPIFVNRLDRETSGVILVAQTPRAAKTLCQQFRAHTVTKRYTVLVEGCFPPQMQAQGWLVQDTHSIIRKKRAFLPAENSASPPLPTAEWSETSFERTALHNGFSRVEVQPHTGRLHQIRATLLSLGFPVVGDKLYGVDETFFLKFCQDTLTDADRALLRLPRQALHAHSLTFCHPQTGILTELTAPLPQDMTALIPQPSEVPLPDC